MKKNKNEISAMSHNVWYVNILKELITYRNNINFSISSSVPSRNNNYDFWMGKYLRLCDLLKSRYSLDVEYIGKLSFVLWDARKHDIIVRADGRNVPVVSGSSVTYLRVDYSWKD